jgi:hypothetical protein
MNGSLLVHFRITTANALREHGVFKTINSDVMADLNKEVLTLEVVLATEVAKIVSKQLLVGRLEDGVKLRSCNVVASALSCSCLKN